MDALRNFDALWTMIAQGVPAGELLCLAETDARARWAGENERSGKAARLFRKAAGIEQSISEMEPP